MYRKRYNGRPGGGVAGRPVCRVVFILGTLVSYIKFKKNFKK